VRVLVTVAVLFAGFESTTPAGADTVAVLESVPVALEETAPVTVKTTFAPGASAASVALRFPLPLAEGQAVPAHVQVSPVKAPEKVSSRVAPVAGLGPELVTVIV
jgi:hypothetical protein